MFNKLHQLTSQKCHIEAFSSSFNDLPELLSVHLMCLSVPSMFACAFSTSAVYGHLTQMRCLPVQSLFSPQALLQWN